MKLAALANAKVNLYLKVLDKRNDGLHNLDMVMQSVSLADKVEIDTDYSDGLKVVCDGENIENNIAETAARLYFSSAEMSVQNLLISIEKNIPVSAGLAGGSADAAAVLVLCNKIYKKFSDSQLIELGGKIGADVPFCMIGGLARVTGFGDKIVSLPVNTDYHLVLIKAAEKRSTGYMYSLLDNMDEHITADADKLISLLTDNSEASCEFMQNDFALLWNDRNSERIKADLISCGANAVSLSGSGPTFFGVFFDKLAAKACCEKLKNKYANVFLASPALCGIQIIE